MAFFLGLSIVSILECICYLFTWCVNKCDGDSEEEERLRQIWKDGMNEVHPDQREQERAQRQSQFNQMEQRLRQMDMYERRWIKVEIIFLYFFLHLLYGKLKLNLVSFELQFVGSREQNKMWEKPRFGGYVSKKCSFGSVPVYSFPPVCSWYTSMTSSCSISNCKNLEKSFNHFFVKSYT